MNNETDVSRGKPSRRALIFGFPGLFHKPRQELCGICFRVMRYGHSPRRFIRIHGNEDTAGDVLSSYMFDHDGVAYIVMLLGESEHFVANRLMLTCRVV